MMFQRRVGGRSLTGLNVLRADLPRNLFQGLTHLALVFRALPIKPHHRAAYETELDISPNLAHCEQEQLAFFSRATPLLFLFVRADLPRGKYVPWRECHSCGAKITVSPQMHCHIGGEMPTFFSSHRDNLALKITLKDTPCSLVNDEWSFASQLGVLVRLGDDPRRRVRDALFTKSVPPQDSECKSQDTYQVQDLASEVESVKAMHDLLNARVPVPLRHHINDMPGHNMDSVLTQCT